MHTQPSPKVPEISPALSASAARSDAPAREITATQTAQDSGRVRPASDDFPYESKFVDVHGSQMHYVEAGQGRPVLFIHGNPTSSYLWRNVLPHLEGQARVIAVDLIGMGRSAHPNIGYSYDDHSRYLEGFIKALGIDDDLTLVVHDWGSMLGLRWANEHADKVRAVAFMEAMIRPLSYADLPGSLKVMMRVMRNPFFNWLLVGVANLFLRVMLQDLTHAKLSKKALAHYRSHYPTVRSRRAVRQFPREVPFDGAPARNHGHVTGYIKWLTQTDVPKLLLHADNGVAIKAAEVKWSQATLSNLQVVDLGPGKHFLQETHPEKIGRALSAWYQGLP